MGRRKGELTAAAIDRGWPHQVAVPASDCRGSRGPYIAEMCGRFTRNYTWEQIHALYRLMAPTAIPNLQPRFNACPTDPADTIVEHEGKRELVEMRWGLVPFWWSKPLKELRLATFNARVETVTTKPFFREPFKTKRCLMPVSGYYEWQDTPEGKQPWYFTARDGSPVLTIAALWDEWKNRETGDRLKSCAMIITEPNELVAEMHDRMPVLQKPHQFEHWLSGNMGVEELRPIDNDYLQRWAVSKRINSSKADSNDPTLIDAVRQAA